MKLCKESKPFGGGATMRRRMSGKENKYFFFARVLVQSGKRLVMNSGRVG